MSTLAETPHEQWIATDYVSTEIALIGFPQPWHTTSKVSVTAPTR
jgi:hypothetical protein